MNGIDVDYYNRRKRELGLTLQQISDRSGVPKRTVDSIFAGKTLTPRVDTMAKIDKVLLIGVGEDPESNLLSDERLLLTCYRKLPPSDKVILLSAMRAIFPALEKDIKMDHVRELLEKSETPGEK